MEVPGILLAIAVVVMLGPSLYDLMIAVGVGAIPTFSRVIRAAVLEAKERDYVAARARGVTDLMIVVRHILPNIMAPFIVLATLDVPTAILSGTALSYLGLHAKPPSPEWGLMLSEGKNLAFKHTSMAAAAAGCPGRARQRCDRADHRSRRRRPLPAHRDGDPSRGHAVSAPMKLGTTNPPGS